MKNDLRRLLASLGDLPRLPGMPEMPGAADTDTEDDGPPEDVGGDSSHAQDIDALLGAQQALSRRHTFKPGDLVRWKRTPQGLSLSNRKRPHANELAVVVGVLKEPVRLADEQVDSGDPTWREPLDLQLGLLHDDGDFLVYHFDSARFEPASAQAARQQAGRELRELQAALAQRHPFEPGTLVRWKPRMKNRKWPAAGQAAVVLEVMAQPLLDPQMNAGTHYFREPLDLVLGVQVRGQFLRMHTDARRFEPLPEPSDDQG